MPIIICRNFFSSLSDKSFRRDGLSSMNYGYSHASCIASNISSEGSCWKLFLPELYYNTWWREMLRRFQKFSGNFHGASINSHLLSYSRCRFRSQEEFSLRTLGSLSRTFNLTMLQHMFHITMSSFNLPPQDFTSTIKFIHICKCWAGRKTLFPSLVLLRYRDLLFVTITSSWKEALRFVNITISCSFSCAVANKKVRKQNNCGNCVCKSLIQRREKLFVLRAETVKRERWREIKINSSV